ncbi:MAG TPA: hypothetical protein EYN64_00365, partial [Flavobacteriales bacterium]|nr:hypothetical protein [Flavobacteriales bacterium]
MRYFFSLALIGLSFSFSAQETMTYPYNPDGDVDGAIASPDLLDLLGVYGGDFSPGEIQIDGVGLLQVIQDLQSQLGAIQGGMIDANYIESTFTAQQQEINNLHQQINSLNQLIADNTLPDGTDIGQLLRWNDNAWIPVSPFLEGCTYHNACNYNPGAIVNDYSCEFTSCAGCTDVDACNFDSEATLNDGSCEAFDERG